MTATLLLAAAAVVDTATWPPTHGILHGVGQSSSNSTVITYRRCMTHEPHLVGPASATP